MMRVRFPSPAPATAGPPATACRRPEGAAVRSRILGTVLIAQISDCHIRDGDGTFGGLIDTSATLARVVSELCSLDPSPDVVLATGDLTEDGTGSQYARLSDLLSDLRVRILPLPGNHDEGAAFRTAFADRLPETVAEGHCSYVVDDYEVRLVGLDTSLPGRHDGHFDDERAEWLEKTLAENPDKPTLLFTHFPPFQTGLCFMDVSGLADADRLRAVIERNPQVRLMVTGHLHRTIQTVIGTTLVSVCPSTGNQLGLDLSHDGGSAVDEPPSYQLHRWDGERFVTHTGVAWDGRSVDLSDFVARVYSLAERGEGFPKG